MNIERFIHLINAVNELNSPKTLSAQTEYSILTVRTEGALIEALELENVTVHFVQFLPSSGASTIDGF